jgi:cytosine/adenosine deaminase-related metal-dependent hydrolase
VSSTSAAHSGQLASIKLQDAEYVVTVDRANRVIRRGTVILYGSRIGRVGTAAELDSIPAERVVDCRGCVITPGFVNGHVHISYAHAVRGLFPDYLPRSSYVDAVFRFQAAMTEEEEYATTLLALTELLKYGTTCLLDPGSTRHLDACIEAYRKAGCRIIVGRHVLDRPTPLRLPVMTIEEAVRATEQTIATFNGLLDGRMRAWAMPFSARVASRDLLVKLKAVADEAGTGLTLHQNFTEAMTTEFVAEHGKRPVQALRDWGVLGPNVVLAHGTGLSEDELHCIADTGVGVIVCPGSAMKLASGFVSTSLLPEMLERGVPLGLGTDSANNSNQVETFRAMYLAAIVFKDARGETGMVPADVALRMATVGGAEALGLDAIVGSLEPGKLADLVVFDSRRPEWRNLYDPITTLVYSADGRSVQMVIVDGRVVVEKGRVTFLDETDLVDRVQALGEGLIQRVVRADPSLRRVISERVQRTW